MNDLSESDMHTQTPRVKGLRACIHTIQACIHTCILLRVNNGRFTLDIILYVYVYALVPFDCKF